MKRLIMFCAFLFVALQVKAEGWMLLGMDIDQDLNKNKGPVAFQALGHQCTIGKEKINYFKKEFYTHERLISCDVNGTKVSRLAIHFTKEDIRDEMAWFDLENSKGKVSLNLLWKRD